MTCINPFTPYPLTADQQNNIMKLMGNGWRFEHNRMVDPNQDRYFELHDLGHGFTVGIGGNYVGRDLQTVGDQTTALYADLTNVVPVP